MVPYSMGDAFRDFKQSLAIDSGIVERADVALQVFVEVEGVGVDKMGPVTLIRVLSGGGGDDKAEENGDAGVHGGLAAVYMTGCVTVAIFRNLRENHLF